MTPFYCATEAVEIHSGAFLLAPGARCPDLDEPPVCPLLTRMSYANGGVNGRLPFSIVSWTGIPP